MPTYSGTGTEPLGSNPNPEIGSQTAPDRSAGKPAEGTANLRAYESAKTAAQWKSGGKAQTPPEGVKHFKDVV